jgi:hypothetical protein
MRTALFILIFIFVQNVNCQESAPDDTVYEKYFADIKMATEKFADLWNSDLSGPILLVDPLTREVKATNEDSLHILKPSGQIFTGRLPSEVNIANTSVSWNGVRWAMVILPLPDSLAERNDLLAHELFHRIQDGRIYLRLELEALKNAIRQSSGKKQRQYLTDAMIFRKYRNSLYRGSESEENGLELNEGLAAYTGLVVSDRTGGTLQKHLISEIDKFYKNPTFVRSFAYHTTPAYGIMLRSTSPAWNKDISDETDLTEYFIKAFKISLPEDLKTETEKISKDYNLEMISKEENSREVRRQKLVNEYLKKFTVDPHVELTFEKMNISFDPGNIVPVDQKGTYYPNIRVSDVWGTLAVTNGALLGPKWDRIFLSVPVKIQGQRATGPGWVLDLDDAYKLFLEDSGDYSLRKK